MTWDRTKKAGLVWRPAVGSCVLCFRRSQARATPRGAGPARPQGSGPASATQRPVVGPRVEILTEIRHWITSFSHGPLRADPPGRRDPRYEAGTAVGLFPRGRHPGHIARPAHASQSPRPLSPGGHGSWPIPSGLRFAEATDNTPTNCPRLQRRCSFNDSRNELMAISVYLPVRRSAKNAVIRP